MKKAEPTIDFSDPSWGKLENEHFTIEFNMGDEEEMSSFAMHVRGNELAVPCIGNILSELGLKALDGSTSGFFNIEGSKVNMKEWIDYRNNVLKK